MTISSVYPTLPAVDIERAKRFYQDKLGLRVVAEDPSPGALMQAGNCQLYIYKTKETKAEHTVASFQVEDVEATMGELRDKGVRFEDYDMPNLKTVNGLFTMNGYKVAWFKDSEGNIVAIANM